MSALAWAEIGIAVEVLRRKPPRPPAAGRLGPHRELVGPHVSLSKKWPLRRPSAEYRPRLASLFLTKRSRSTPMPARSCRDGRL